MYLSQLILNPRSRQVQQDCANRTQIHKTVYSGFAETIADDERILFRLETDRDGSITALVQSQDSPQWSRSEQINSSDYLLYPIEEKVFQPRFKLDQLLHFRLCANPTMKRDGKRVALRKEDEQTTWLMRKGEEHGFHIENLRLAQDGAVSGWRSDQRMTWNSVRFDGVLVIRDPEAFYSAVSKGIGSAKSFGFGLLSVIPYAVS